MTTHIREPMHLSISSVHPVDDWHNVKNQAGLYLGARFVKPFGSQVGRAETRYLIKTILLVSFLLLLVYPTQHEISKMLEMSPNRENEMKRWCSSS
jgi:hypothetical protein